MVMGLGWIVSKQVMCVEFVQFASFIIMRVEETNNQEFTHTEQSGPL